MGKALYRKYRSKSLSEIVGQEHITTALNNALKKGQISHAYLFTGPRGTGKTSVARILAYELNGLPYDETATHLDIIEIDAASNRRIDEIRELRERVHNAPASAKYKVYIIDEVHMLTREAFNALLKTLEEPPEHAIFILATTEAHKLPETIISRTQRYSFKPIELQKAINHLRNIAQKEKITISDEALDLIARHGDGSLRDSTSLLDQVRNQADKVSLETVQQALGIAPETAVQDILKALESASTESLLITLEDMKLKGYHAAQVAKQLAEVLRQRLLANSTNIPTEVIGRLLRELLDVPTAQDSARLLELILLEAVLAMPGREQKVGGKRQDVEGPEKEVKKIEDKLSESVETAKPKALTAVDVESKEQKPELEIVSNAGTQNSSPPSGALNAESWQLVLQAIKARHNTLYSVARMAVPTFQDGELILAFSFPFHQKRLNDAKNRQVISDVIQETTGQSMTITCIVDIEARTKPAAVTAPPEPDPSIATISNIFGSAEVVD